MFWADILAKKIIDSGKHTPYWIDDMFTPSGYAHIGSLRGPIVHDLVYRAFVHAGKKTTFTYIFNDFDPIDGLPKELDHLSSEMGKPLRLARPPEKGYGSFAHYFTADFQEVLRNLGVMAEFRSSWDMYHAGMFDGVIREALDNASRIQDIYRKVSGSKKREKGWLPLQVVCEKCQRLGTTRVHAWDGTHVTYTCEPTMVTWARGCGYSGKISPFSDKNNAHHHPGKLPWKVDWPAHWKVLGVTIEGAGKDHSSAGGSRDIAKELCKYVFGIPNPYNVPYEFFLIGGKKMSSSKGLGLKARDLKILLAPSIGRFLFTRADYKKSIEFNPVGTMAIPDLYDEYDRCWTAYNTEGDEGLSRAFEMAQIGDIPDKNPHLFLARFRDIARLYQLPNVDLFSRLSEIKGSPLTAEEKNIINIRLADAITWVNNYAPDDFTYQLSTVPFQDIHLTGVQWKFLNKLADIWENVKDPEKLQSLLFTLAKSLKLDHKKAFGALYSVVLGKDHGPRAGWMLKQFPKDAVLDRLLLNKKEHYQEQNNSLNAIEKPEYFSIDPHLKENIPSISIGIAMIRNVSISSQNKNLDERRELFLSSLTGLTTEKLGTYPEIVSYRKLYKEMGVDWHSRRPSPEALIRRVALGKGLYSVNTCVDAYNLVVMKQRVSVGAFDADQIQFPTVIRYAGVGDEILLLGDKVPSKYTSKEIAYYDQVGGYNMDFNYRDAQRTMVTEKTKNLWINVDGVYDITPEMVQNTLHESVEIITQYCGGTVDFEGVVC